MFLQGQYGLEFDSESSGTGFHAAWLLVALPLAALVFLLVRGCGTDKPKNEPPDPTQAERFDQPDTSLPERERFSWQAVGQLIPGKAAKGKPAPAAGPQQKRPLRPAVNPAALSRLPPTVQKLYAQADAAENANDLAAARLALLRLLRASEADAFLSALEHRLGELGMRLLFSSQPMDGKKRCRIAPGDSVARLAKRYGCTEEYILSANGVDNPAQLRIGRELWVLDHPDFQVFVNSKQSTVTITLGRTFFKRYALDVALDRLPAGEYKVRSRGCKEDISHPSSAAQRVPGICWISLRPATEKMTTPYGLYASPSPAKEAAFPGVFLSPADVAELYLLLPAGTPVLVF